MTISTQSNVPYAMTLATIQRAVKTAMRIIRELPDADNAVEHLAASQLTIDKIAATIGTIHQPSTGIGNVFGGLRIMRDDDVPDGCLEARNKAGVRIAINGGIR